jgi:hypothetical protein
MRLFIYGLFNDTASKSDCIMLKYLMNLEYWMVKDFEGRSYSLIWGISQYLPWRGGLRTSTKKTSGRTAGALAETVACAEET